MKLAIVQVLAVFALTVAYQASAQVMTFNPSSVATGTDGQWNPPIPRDGVFDKLWGGEPAASILPNNLTDSRFAVEYNISAIPVNSSIDLATLTFNEWVDGPSTIIQLHGYAGDGIADLHDMVANNLLFSDISDGIIGTTVLPVTTFITFLVNQGEPFAGFMARDVQGTPFVSPNILNYYQIRNTPSLTISYSTVPEPYAVLLLLSGFGLLSFTRRNKRLHQQIENTHRPNAR